MFGLPECTLCGKRIDAPNKVEIEDAVVEVCDDCIKFGKVVETKLYKPMAKRIQLNELAGLANDASGEELAADYGMRVKSARQARGLTHAEFASAINERESVIRRIESQNMKPDEALMQKFAKFLKIKLRDE